MPTQVFSDSPRWYKPYAACCDSASCMQTQQTAAAKLTWRSIVCLRKLAVAKQALWVRLTVEVGKEIL